MSLIKVLAEPSSRISAQTAVGHCSGPSQQCVLVLPSSSVPTLHRGSHPTGTPTQLCPMACPLPPMVCSKPRANLSYQSTSRGLYHCKFLIIDFPKKVLLAVTNQVLCTAAKCSQADLDPLMA